MRRMRDLGMELHRIPRAPVAHRGDRNGRSPRESHKAGRGLPHRVAVAHPGALGLAEALEDPAVLADLDGSWPVLALALRHNVAAENVRHELHAVADAEHRQRSIEDRRIDPRRTRLVHRGRTARQDDADHAARV